MKDPNALEHDHIVLILTEFAANFTLTGKKVQLIDKYACILTSFMRGEIIQAIKDQHVQLADKV